MNVAALNPCGVQGQSSDSWLLLGVRSISLELLMIELSSEKAAGAMWASSGSVRSLRWLRRCQGCRMEGINVPTCPAQLLPPLEDGSCSADRNPTGPWGLHHFIPTRSDLTNSTFQSVCIRGSCPKCWSFSKFSLCNQSSSLKLPVNPFSSLSPPQQSCFL